MARIGFFVLPNTGSMNACLKLAADLRERGHEVAYFGLKDSETYIRANGFAFTPVFEEHFPKGYFSDDLRQEGLFAGLRKIGTARAHFRRFFTHILGGGDEEFLSLLRAWQPNLMVFASGDPHIEWPALMAYAAGKNSVYFYDALWPCERSRLPTVETDLVPTPALAFTVRNYVAWKRYHLMRTLPDRLMGFPRFTRQLAARYGYHTEFYDNTHKRHTLVRLPELVPFPTALEFPGAEEIPGRHYIEASIWLERKQPEFPWEWLDEGCPLVLCALGTYLWFDAEWYQRFFRIVLDVARAKPEWQWVLGTGRLVDPPGLGPLPRNVIAVETVPQLALLQRARMMITHGGTNTIKECVYFGVPMVILPFGGDHPGNTARLIYHGLGVKGDLQRLSVRSLKEQVEAVDRSFYIQSQMQLMRERVRRLEEEKPGVRLIENWLVAGDSR
ncbi:MAG: nucleotide disphospho-sugar-binding domain-containing protein [Gammaproteobacteria bacterium]